MPTPPDASYPQDGHAHLSQIHSHFQPENTQPGYYQHPHVLYNQPSPYLTHALNPALIDTHQQLSHLPGQIHYGYPTGFGQPRQQQPTSQWRTAQMQFPMNQQTHQLARSQEPNDGSDDKDEDVEGDEEPVAVGCGGKGNRKRPMKGTNGPANKKHKLNEQDDGGDRSRTPASAAVPKPKFTRGSRACTNCRRLKMKCIGADKDAEGKCERCRSNNQQCHFEESRRKDSRRGEILMRQLKHMERTLDILMRSKPHPDHSLPVEAATHSPTASPPSAQALMDSPSAGTPDMENGSASLLQKPLEKPRSNSPRLHILPDNTNPIGLRAEASLASHREKDASSGIGGMLTGNINEDDGSGKIDGRPVGVGSDAYAKPGYARGM
ncbi:unnamed protein product [Rhizoctonia solani]|uniref:Zn(2)-C6 fungal-type domain-containing protein n=1 Tax=Rhizoctonia solani TaxID=456999 RepID=A0A8H3B7Y4_9AGAM|nr:unnamed protein product [Rhizoctonia solani]